MRYPYERFLRFLISRKADLVDLLRRLELPPVGDLYAPQCRAMLRRDAPQSVLHYFEADDKVLHFQEGFLGWAEAHEIRPLWEIQSEFRNEPAGPDLATALRIFSYPMGRSVLGLLLLSKATDTEILTAFKDRFDLEISPAALGHFRHFFWDLDIIGREGWTSFISVLERDQRHILAQGMGHPSIEDVRVAIGIDVQLEPKDVFREVMTQAHYRFKDAMSAPDPIASEALKWADLALRAAHELEAKKVVPAGTTDVIDTAMFSVIPETTKIPSLNELVGEVGKPKSKALEAK